MFVRTILFTALIATCAFAARSSNRRYRVGPEGGKPHLQDQEPPYPYWSGVELATAGLQPKIEIFADFTCPDCADHWTGVVQPILQKYSKNISFVSHPFALPYHANSYDATLAALAVYRLTNSAASYKIYADTLFKNQQVLWNTYTLSQQQVWTNYFGAWAEQSVKVKTIDLINAMNGTITTANDDAWYAARFARQRTLPGAPTFIMDDWLPFDIDTFDMKFADWDKWISSAIVKQNKGK
eukprot:PhF_6_TR26968/c0_g1_i2/m.39339